MRHCTKIYAPLDNAVMSAVWLPYYLKHRPREGFNECDFGKNCDVNNVEVSLPPPRSLLEKHLSLYGVPIVDSCVVLITRLLSK